MPDINEWHVRITKWDGGELVISLYGVDSDFQYSYIDSCSFPPVATMQEAMIWLTRHLAPRVGMGLR